MNQVWCLPFSLLGEEKSLDNKVWNCHRSNDRILKGMECSGIILCFQFYLERGPAIAPSRGCFPGEDKPRHPKSRSHSSRGPGSPGYSVRWEKKGEVGRLHQTRTSMPPLPQEEALRGRSNLGTGWWVGCLRRRTPAGVGVACRGNREIGSWVSPASWERCGRGERERAGPVTQVDLEAVNV